MIAWSIGWGDQSEVGMFRRGRFRTCRREQSVRELLTALGFRESPRSGINEGKALDRG